MSARPGWRRRRLLGGLVAVAAAGLVLWLALGALRSRRAAQVALPPVSGELRAPGLREAVAIDRDARGIPHVEATGEHDAWFALGFVHAQDRPAQMLWLRASARGRAAEWVGAEALPADRTARVVGIGLLADAQAKRLDPETRAVLEAYAAGVNARLERIRSGEEPRPLALQEGDEALAPWTPADSIAVVKLRAWALGSSMETSLVLADLIEVLGGVAAKPYFPGAPREAPPAPAPDVADATPDADRADTELRRIDPLRRALGLAGRGVGSSVWVVAGRGSASGRPLVAGDLHAEPTVPGPVYEAHVRGGDLDVAGVTIPGAPVFWSGANRRVAWASSFEPVVVTDLFVETLASGAPLRWHDGSRWRPVLERRERIAVRGGETEELVVHATGHGPLVNGLVGGERPPLALAWTGALPGDGIEGFLRLASAGGAADVRVALRRHHEPVLAVAWADASGAAGLQLAGGLPRRPHSTGYVPVPGRGGEWDWQGTVPFDLLPARSPDATGFALASDARLGGLAEIEWLWRPGATAARLETLLAGALEAGPVALRDLAALQHDRRNETARATTAAVVALAGDTGALGGEGREVRDAIARWDGGVEAESVGAAVYHVFLQRLAQELLVERLGPELAERYVALPQTRPLDLVSALVRTGAALPAEESVTLRRAVQRSLRETWLWLSVEAGPNRERWAWGRLHPLRFRPLGLFPGLPAGAESALGPFPFGGDGTTVAQGGYDLADPFEVRVASVYRYAVDTAQLDQALTMLVPGQSEHPGSPHLDDAVPGWLAGRARLLLTSPLLIDETARSRLVLRP